MASGFARDTQLDIPTAIADRLDARLVANPFITEHCFATGNGRRLIQRSKPGGDAMQAVMSLYAQLPAIAQGAARWAALWLLIALTGLLLDYVVRLLRTLKASKELCAILHWTSLMLACLDCGLIVAFAAHHAVLLWQAA
jgi:hypothetical protein